MTGRRLGAVVALGAALAVSACSQSSARPGPAEPATTAGVTTDASRPATTVAVPVDAGYGAPVLLGRVDDASLAESSGLVASRRNPGLLWTHNDSGDDPNLYCLTREATRCGTWRVTGAKARDWEDMAAGPGPLPGPYLYLGDIGDNRRTRRDIVVYRVAEPAAPAPGPQPVPSAPSVARRLRYEDGPHNAEALLVHPTTGVLYVVTKGFRAATVYRADPEASVLRRIASLSLGLEDLVTGGDIAPDGRRVALSTYGRAYELTLPAEATTFDEVWEQPARPLSLAPRAQGEAIAYRLDARALLTTSEGAPFPLHEVSRR